MFNIIKQITLIGVRSLFLKIDQISLLKPWRLQLINYLIVLLDIFSQLIFLLSLKFKKF